MAGDHRAGFRPATFEDRDGATALLHSFGMGGGADPEHVRRWWSWIWERNPALHMGRPRPPLGWVLEDGGEIVGFFGNVPARYQLADTELLVAVASHWAVLKPYRGQTQELSTAYFAQQEADLLMVTTGSVATGRIFTRFGASPMPLLEYQDVLYWVLEPSRFARAALRRKHMKPWIARALAGTGGPLLKAALALSGHGPRRRTTRVEAEAIQPDQAGDEFDELWQRKLAEGPRLYASRRAEDIRWHFELAPTDSVRILRLRREGRLAGYLILLQESVEEVGLSRAKIVDLFVAADDADATLALLRAAHEMAKALGCHVLELVGMPLPVRERARTLRPLSRRFDVHPWLFKAPSPALDASLRSRDAWYPTLYDGDSCLAPL